MQEYAGIPMLKKDGSVNIIAVPISEYHNKPPKRGTPSLPSVDGWVLQVLYKMENTNPVHYTLRQIIEETGIDRTTLDFDGVLARLEGHQLVECTYLKKPHIFRNCAWRITEQGKKYVK